MLHSRRNCCTTCKWHYADQIFCCHKSKVHFGSCKWLCFQRWIRICDFQILNAFFSNGISVYRVFGSDSRFLHACSSFFFSFCLFFLFFSSPFSYFHSVFFLTHIFFHSTVLKASCDLEKWLTRMRMHGRTHSGDLGLRWQTMKI